MCVGVCVWLCVCIDQCGESHWEAQEVTGRWQDERQSSGPWLVMTLVGKSR